MADEEKRRLKVIVEDGPCVYCSLVRIAVQPYGGCEDLTEEQRVYNACDGITTLLIEPSCEARVQMECDGKLFFTAGMEGSQVFVHSEHAPRILRAVAEYNGEFSEKRCLKIVASPGEDGKALVEIVRQTRKDSNFCEKGNVFISEKYRMMISSFSEDERDTSLCLLLGQPVLVIGRSRSLSMPVEYLPKLFGAVQEYNEQK